MDNKDTPLYRFLSSMSLSYVTTSKVYRWKSSSSHTGLVMLCIRFSAEPALPGSSHVFSETCKKKLVATCHLVHKKQQDLMTGWWWAATCRVVSSGWDRHPEAFCPFVRAVPRGKKNCFHTPCIKILKNKENPYASPSPSDTMALQAQRQCRAGLQLT